MASSLPYPGFSWSISQHIGPGTEPRAIYELLQAAYTYSRYKNYAEKINEYITGQGLLSANVRKDSGKPDLWRDYQQVLSELGLIFSTKYTDGVVVTPIGLMYLDGAIGYAELLTTQVLNYQYPNGHKRDISPSQRSELVKASISARWRFELDAQHGVLIKPAILILRILLELRQLQEQRSSLSIDEVLYCLVPTKRNSEWRTALAELLAFRRDSIRQNSDTRRRRHVQEWFRLLDMTDLFVQGDDERIDLSDRATTDLEFTDQLCQYHESESSFWLLPTIEEPRRVAVSWFGHFGNPDSLSQWLVSDMSDLQYVEDNYLAVEDEDDQDPLALTRERNAEVNLHPFTYERDRDHFSYDIDKPNLIDQSRARIRQQKSTRLHEEIVVALATKLRDANYHIQEDPSSVDLLATRGDSQTILEVKTVTRRNLDQRVRLGVGQLLEYRYRFNRQFNTKPNAVLVLSNTAGFADWTRDYFSRDIQLGLVSFTNYSQFSAYTTGEIETVLTR